MSRITNIFLTDTAEQKAIAIHSTVSVPEIPAIIGESFMKLEEFMKNKGINASDTPFLQISGTDPNAVNIIAGVAVSETVSGKGEFEDYLIPAGKKIFCYWLGSNSNMSPLYEEMERFAQLSDYKVEEGFYEYYLNGPAYGTDNLLTKVVMLLR